MLLEIAPKRNCQERINQVETSAQLWTKGVAGGARYSKPMPTEVTLWTGWAISTNPNPSIDWTLTEIGWTCCAHWWTRGGHAVDTGGHGVDMLWTLVDMLNRSEKATLAWRNARTRQMPKSPLGPPLHDMYRRWLLAHVRLLLPGAAPHKYLRRLTCKMWRIPLCLTCLTFFNQKNRIGELLF